MTFRIVGPETEIVVDCDVCRDSLEDGDWVIRFATEAGAAAAASAAGWVQTETEMVCTRENLAHLHARGLTA